MTNDIQAKAEFYAKLANVKNLEKLGDGEKAQLIADAIKADLLPRILYSPKAIWDVQPWARRLIGGLLDKSEVDTTEFEEKLTNDRLRVNIWKLDKKARRVKLPPRSFATWIFTSLLEVIQADPFPFDRCSICDDIFVPGKNQKYCSKPCATKALAPWKKRYMKDYMADKRTEERKAKAHGH
jgi:hypothetical protein